MDKSDVELEHVTSIEAMDPKKVATTAYIADTQPNSHHKSPAERRLVLKADLVILPLASLIYFVAYLDRNSIGNARIMGLQKDLRLTGNDYYNCLTMFFVGYTVFMLPGNVLLRYLTPHMQMGGATVIFGALLCGMSAAQNYHTVLALRILIGSAQAFIQGLGLYTSLWYKRDEVATRGAVYYSAATLAGAFSGLIAYGVQKDLTKTGTGRDPWRWFFIIEGSISMGVGVITWLLLPQFPDQMGGGKHWLFTEEEKKLAVERSASYNTIGAKLELKQVWVTLKDPKPWMFAMINAGVALGISSVGLFLPTFISEFGYSRVRTQLFSVIPYSCAFVTLLLVCVTSDRLNVKGPCLIFCLSISCIGYVILLTDVGVHVKIFASCLCASGLYPSVILLISWLGVNTGGFTKRGTTWAMAEVFGQSFSIMGTHVYNSPPRFVKGHSIVLGFLLWAILNAVALIFWMRHLNAQRDRTEREYEARSELHPHASRSLEEEHDFHISFRYII